MNFIEVSLDEPDSICLFKEFYQNLYVPAFPNEDERETLENFFKYMCVNGFDSLISHIIVCTDDENKPIAGVIFDYFEEVRAYLVEFIVVAAECRVRGTATQILRYVENLIMQKYEKPLDWLIIEIDDPTTREDEEKAYLHFWKRQGMKRIDIDYIQPALSSEQLPVSTLWLCAKNLKYDAITIDKLLIQRYLYLFAKYAILIEEPDLDPVIHSMNEKLSAISCIELTLTPLNEL